MKYVLGCDNYLFLLNLLYFIHLFDLFILLIIIFYLFIDPVVFNTTSMVSDYSRRPVQEWHGADEAEPDHKYDAADERNDFGR